MIRKSLSVKKILIAIILLALLAGAAVFVLRYQILQYSTEKLVRKLLPDYIVVEKMGFNFRESKVVFNTFKILNPPNFSNKYLIEIGEIDCHYRLKGRSILDGIEIMSPVFSKPALYIERRSDGRTNLHEMQSFLEAKDREAKSRKQTGSRMAADIVTSASPGKAASESKAMKDSGLSGMVKLPENFIVKDGTVIFLDGMVRPGTYTITLNNVDANLHLELDSAYTRALNISTTGIGIVNGRGGETIKWDTKFDPTASELTMSNRFNVSGVDILAFRPYYDKYSPLVFRSGYFSGTLVFDFDNGSIGSTNEVLLSKISFAIKSGYENARFLETTVPDLVKYFTSASGDIIFDFKIKGRMSDPQFYLGPISKQAVAAMAIDKITQALSDAVKDQANPTPPAPGAGKTSDIEKASEYINMFKNLLKEKK